LNNIKDKLFSFQDLFPLAEGDYKLNILLKNTISKEFTSMEQSLFIPGPAAGMRMSRLVLGNRVIRNSEYRGTNKPFLFGDFQIVSSPRNDFVPQDKLYLYFQITDLSRDLLASGSLEYAILKEGEKVFSAAKTLKDYADPVNFLEEFSLVQLGPAYYKIKVSLRDQAGNEVLSEQKDFVITYLTALPRPWILSIPQPPSGNSMYANILGNQYLNKKDTEKAKSLLGEAYRKNPGSKKFALDYCRILFMDKEYPRIKEVAAPFLQSQEKYEFLSVLGQSSQALGELAEAISFYKEYLSHYGTNILILNSIGECYYQMGNPEEALVAWKKSLEMNPKQEDIKKMVDSIKKKQ
jgi:tetratricopeptide (TPR) repeat protein